MNLGAKYEVLQLKQSPGGRMFKEQVCIDNDLVEDTEEMFNDKQCVKFLHSAVTGVPHLASVLNT